MWWDLTWDSPRLGGKNLNFQMPSSSRTLCFSTLFIFQEQCSILFSNKTQNIQEATQITTHDDFLCTLQYCRIAEETQKKDVSRCLLI